MSCQIPAQQHNGPSASELARSAEIEALHQALARVEVLLAAAPRRLNTAADAIAADIWLAEVELLLHRTDSGDKARLLAAAAEVRFGLSAVRRPQLSSDVDADLDVDLGATAGGSPHVNLPQSRSRAQAHADMAEAAGIYAALGHENQAATMYITAALTALRQDQIHSALELAVQGIVTFNSAPVIRSGAFAGAEPTAGPHLAGTDRAGEAMMALALGRLCWEFFDPERAMRFAEIAAGELLGANDERRWAEAGQLHAEACLLRARDVIELHPLEWTELVERAMADGEQLRSHGPTALARRVVGPRLIAEVWCLRGEPARAEDLLDEALAAGLALTSQPRHQRELAALRVARGRCRYLLGRHEEALAELAEAQAPLVAVPLTDRLAVLELRLEVREAVGDLVGALRDSRRISALVGAQHRRQISGFLDQVWGLAAHESRRRALEERQQDLIRTAEQDPLTGLANRRGVERFCASLLHEEAMSVAVVDVDHFKRVNDRFGHQVGDAVLKRLAETMSGCVRGVDMLGRWGGEEFVIVLPRTSLEWGIEAAARIRRQIALVDWSDLVPGRSVTVSVGVAHGHAGDFGSVLGEADRGLYRAKAAGRDRVATSASSASH